jgi:glycosyltransferase involved in cell wall biosynthesis
MTDMKHGPTACIVIPTFNRKLLLLEAVESCLNQTWANCRVIIVDDGSTDGTPSVVAQMLQTSWWGGRVRYVRQENAGAAAARNHGLELSHGKYVQFLDSDDILYPGKIAKQIDVLERSANQIASCCYCYGHIGVSVAKDSGRSRSMVGFHTTTPKELVRELCSRRVHGMQTSAPLWRYSFLEKHSGWREDIGLGDDLEFHIRLVTASDKICFIDEALFFIREHSGSRLGGDSISACSVASLIRTRQAILETLQSSAQWDAQTQRAFLGAMRTVYANALQLGNPDTIHSLEKWLWALATTPKRVRELQVLILSRRMLGRHFLLSTHRLISRIRPN